MPNTITAYNTFTANTKAKSSEVNVNFNNHRGTILPVDPNTAAATGDTYNVGTDEHRWLGGFFNYMDYKTSTSTASLVVKGDAANTTGSLLYQVGSVTVAEIDSGGFNLNYAKTGSINTTGAFADGILPNISKSSFAATGTLTITGGVTAVFARGYGGGGGGGGGAGNAGGGGAGGAGAPHLDYLIDSLTSGDILSITVGLGGGGGIGATSGAGSNGVTGQNSTIRLNAGTIYVFPGGEQGKGGDSTNGGLGGTNNREDSYHPQAWGGDGGASGLVGLTGGSSAVVSGGAKGAGNSGGGGGGGGSSLIVNLAGGGDGGDGGLASGVGGTAVDGTRGSGGGGGGGGGSGGFNGGLAGDGGPGFVAIRFIE